MLVLRTQTPGRRDAGRSASRPALPTLAHPESAGKPPDHRMDPLSPCANLEIFPKNTPF